MSSTSPAIKAPSPLEPCNPRAIEAIFGRMLVRYGVAWTRMWGELPTEMVKADWADELGPMPRHRIDHALANLPADPPNCAKFKALCLAAPSQSVPALPAPKADPARAAAILGKLRDSFGAKKPQEWVANVTEKIAQGHTPTIAVRSMLRSAIESPMAAPLHTDMEPVPFKALPPGMKADARAGLIKVHSIAKVANEPISLEELEARTQ